MLVIVRLDAIMKSSTIALLESLEQKAFDNEYSAVAKTAQSNISRKDERVPPNFVERFRRVLTDAGSLFWHHAPLTWKVLWCRANQDVISVTERDSFFCVASKDEKHQNSDRQCTKALWHSKSGLYYILLTSAAFSKMFSDGIGGVPHWYEYCTTSLSSPLRPCSRHTCKQAVNDSNKERNISFGTDSDVIFR